MTEQQSREVALVTGSGSGIGEAIAIRFAKDGMPVGVLDLNAEAAKPRLYRPEEIAAACAFIVSKETGYATAQHLGVNGGAVG